MKIDSAEFTQMQRERIYKTKPWEKSTGPKTAEGKERSKMNALKINIKLHNLIKEYEMLIKQQKKIFGTVSHNTTINFKDDVT